MGDTLSLYFEEHSELELVRSEFTQGDSKSLRTCIRGKTAGAFVAFGSFQWTSAVRAVAAVVIRYAIAEKAGAASYCLVGGKGSLAASLDYALSKGPGWIQEMFGTMSAGSLYAKRLFRITNPNRKRPGPVALSVNSSRLPISEVRIFLNGVAVDGVEVLTRMLNAIEGSAVAIGLSKEPANAIDLVLSPKERANS
jgi:hypothetical protein